MTLDPPKWWEAVKKKKKNNVPATSCPHHGGDEATYFETDPTVLEITELPPDIFFYGQCGRLTALSLSWSGLQRCS